MNTLVVAKVLLVNDDQQLLLLQRSESDPRRPLEWDVPGGHTDGDEFAEDAAARETLEESGIDISARSLRLLYTMTEAVNDNDLSVSWLFYTAKTIQTEVVLSDEHVASRWVSLAEALELLDYERQKRVLIYVQQHNLLSV